MTVLEARAPRAPLSPNALILIAACVGLGWAVAAQLPPVGPITFAFVAATWILSVGVHEFGHAFAAWKAGDHTIVEKGYLTLDPLKYSDLVTTIVIPLLALAMGGIGFPGGAVYLREDLMRSKAWRSLASLAGPLGTLAVLLVLAVTLPFVASPDLRNALSLLAMLQGSALVLNLLPIPGLDGYGVLRPFLPDGVRAGMLKIERIGFLILFGLIFFVPGASRPIFGAALSITDLLGVPRSAIAAGWDAFHFWGA
ncbi:site-2 protease family protein [Caulobacter sp. RHG1]|uniref:site-2 protease family protein n=1 Tax=Caulobacter sp. (strain RHG1) TaxID=2545762 RepID=UPI0015517118|nr:site-2 protease family protein [Caulobacter sp. RHG1]NQE65135.1 Zinc metalloprotease [Caulobacter sp. RHG1]